MLFVFGYLVVTDWNNTLAPAYRQPITRYVPAFFLAFPPFRVTNRPADQCPVFDHKLASIDPNERHNGMYKDEILVPTDSFFGALLYTLSVVCFVMVLLGYGWLFYTMIYSADKEFKDSRWVGTVRALRTLRDNEVKHYVVRNLRHNCSHANCNCLCFSFSCSCSVFMPAVVSRLTHLFFLTLSTVENVFCL